MKTIIVFASLDVYTPEMRCVKTYNMDGGTSLDDIISYHKINLGRTICGLSIFKIDGDTKEMEHLHTFSTTPRKKIVINKSVKTPDISVASDQDISDMFNSLGSSTIPSGLLFTTAAS
jgi:hypothetical protein